jgi:hypothetical protein
MDYLRTLWNYLFVRTTPNVNVIEINDNINIEVNNYNIIEVNEPVENEVNEPVENEVNEPVENEVNEPVEEIGIEVNEPVEIEVNEEKIDIEIKNIIEEIGIEDIEDIENTIEDIELNVERFFLSDDKYAIIHGPTQQGKTYFTSNTCMKKALIPKDILIIVSVPNVDIQKEQFSKRVKEYISVDSRFRDVCFVNANDPEIQEKMKKCFSENGSTKMILFTLNNLIQLKKLENALDKNIKEIVIFHDEGDTIITHPEMSNPYAEGVPVTHGWWLSFEIKCHELKTKFKRIFITATLESPAFLLNIPSRNLFSIGRTEDYSGYNSIELKTAKTMKDGIMRSKEQLVKLKKQIELDEVNFCKFYIKKIRNDKTYEAILYSNANTIKEQDRALRIFAILGCTVNTYNGKNGIKTFIPETYKQKFIDNLKNKNIKPVKNNDKVYITINDMTIQTFYTIMKEIGENCIITIGKEYMGRGISFVGMGKNPIVASKLIFTASKDMSLVALNQLVGRITGRAGENLERIWFAPEKDFYEYKKYNINQEYVINNVLDNQDKNEIIRDVMDRTRTQKTRRNIEGPKLKIVEYATVLEVEQELEEILEEIPEEKVKRLITGWKRNLNWNISKIFLEVCRLGSINENDLKNYIFEENENGIDMKRAIETVELLTRNHKREYHLIFQKQNNIIKLTPEAKRCIN